jgi:hypothetical protein
LTLRPREMYLSVVNESVFLPLKVLPLMVKVTSLPDTATDSELRKHQKINSPREAENLENTKAKRNSAMVIHREYAASVSIRQ